jgi:GNAT superfamily N-acetyltransferase
VSKGNIKIRDARTEELDQVADLLKKAYSQYESYIPDASWKDYLENIIDVRSRLPEADLIVAEVDGRLAGTVTLYLKYNTPPMEGWPQGWAGIRLLAVHPDYRGRRISRALMEECIRRCRKQGIKTMALHTADIMHVAMSLYEKMGFQRIPEFDFHPRPDVVVKAYRLDL